MEAQMIPVQSSVFAAIGYDETNREFLARYKTGTTWAFANTAPEEFETVRKADSIGVAFNQIIKPAKKGRKLEAEPVEPDIPASFTEDRPGLRIVEATPDSELAVRQTTDDLAGRALSLQITDDHTHVRAQELLIAIGSMRKQVIAHYEPLKTAAHRTHKVICEKENETLQPLLNAHKAIAARIVAFEKEVEDRRKAEENKLRLEAQAQAEREAKEEAERLALEDALELEASGDTQGAEAVLANPMPIPVRYIPPPPVVSSLQRVSGAVVRERWVAIIENAAIVPDQFVIRTIDQTGLNQYANRRGELAVVPGVRFVRETSMHSRAK